MTDVSRTAFPLSDAQMETREASIVLSTRVALRVLPIAISLSPRPLGKEALNLFRSTAIGYAAAAHEDPDHAFKDVGFADVHFAVAAKKLPSPPTFFRRAQSAIRPAAELVRTRERSMPRHRLLTEQVRRATNLVRDVLGDPAGSDFVANVTSDMFRLADGADRRDLLQRSLWSAAQPWHKDIWQDACVALDADPQWSHWKGWYQEILKANRDFSSLGFRIALAATVADTDRNIWRADVESANSLLKARVQYPVESEHVDLEMVPVVPSPRPAALEPVELADGRIAISRRAAKSQLEPDSLEAALAALRTGFVELAQHARAAGNIDQRSIYGLEALAQKIPHSAPTQQELFALGHIEQLLGFYGKTVNDEWPPFLAATYHALSRQFDDTIRQFPAWREFKRNASKDLIDSARVDASIKLVSEAIETLKSEAALEFVDHSVPEALEELARPLVEADASAPFDFIEAGKEELAADVIESLNNFLKKLSDIMLRVISTIEDVGAPYVEGFKEEFAKTLKTTGKNHGKRIVVWGSSLITAWITKFLVFPHTEWLQIVKQFLANLKLF